MWFRAFILDCPSPPFKNPCPEGNVLPVSDFIYSPTFPLSPHIQPVLLTGLNCSFTPTFTAKALVQSCSHHFTAHCMLCAHLLIITFSTPAPLNPIPHVALWVYCVHLALPFSAQLSNFWSHQRVYGLLTLLDHDVPWSLLCPLPEHA